MGRLTYADYVYERTLLKAPNQRGGGILIAIAVFKLMKAAMMILIGIGAIRYMHRDVGEAVRNLTHHLRGDPHNRFIHSLIEKCTGITPKTLELLSVGTFFYAAIFIVEGIGLLMRKRWAEWLTVVSGALLIPFEIYEIVKSPHLARVVVLVLNVSIVAYLIVQLRRTAKPEAMTHPTGSPA